MELLFGYRILDLRRKNAGRQATHEFLHFVFSIGCFLLISNIPLCIVFDLPATLHNVVVYENVFSHLLYSFAHVSKKPADLRLRWCLQR